MSWPVCALVPNIERVSEHGRYVTALCKHTLTVNLRPSPFKNFKREQISPLTLTTSNVLPQGGPQYPWGSGSSAVGKLCHIPQPLREPTPIMPITST